MKTILLSLFMAVLIPLSVPGADYTVTVNNDSVLFALDTIYHGVNYVGFWDNSQGSDGSRDALRRAGVKILRFPGGEPANYFDWGKATTWTSTTMSSLKAYADNIGAKLMLQTDPTVNAVNDDGDLNDSSAVHMAAWVTYCKNNGVSAPFWEVGNEPESGNSWAQADWDSTKLGWYYNAFKRQATAMHVADASIKVMGPVAANTYYWWALHDLPMFLHFCDSQADAVSLHWYPYGNNYPGWDNVKGLAQTWKPCMDYIRTVTQKPVFITEWSAHAGNAGSLQKVMALALSSADMIGAFAQTGVAGHCWFGSIHNVTGNQWGFLYGAGQSRPLDTPAPSYFILPLWSHMGNRVLLTHANADSANILSAYAHRKPDNSLQVMVINKSVSASVAVSFTGFSATGKSVSIFELKPKSGTVWDSVIVYNGAEDPNASTTDLPDPATVQSDSATFVRTLPAYSITVMDFPALGTAVQVHTPLRTVQMEKSGKVLVLNGAIMAGPSLLKSGKTLGLYTIQGRKIAAGALKAGRIIPGFIGRNGVYVVREETK